ncbi:5-formyltetrahydrofolate cyclo-ligase [Lactobacillus nasalidis]|uniref:5-formyltetrahydrofolate cyclo-ligase n=1 Tax=Lactobacillus nasalidis TaxID=2797258 RepID=A0ABQ3W2X5_9LACO|nr:5-formyltetrahydrofolate cyclo-ligase [Lactobacillus nasalidis]GHV98360.1 5-formyltetrahydrofolate cyclo-ligase [Lactobacillus nasalidis]GHV99856.1 5-formyltetrahydrofolate cyclo-ligase [Lactobacillus nasalidis]GHW00693.1 5-formyltetrahydrofolate cyclo-ligase [Lactobacillus nasalidis]
MNKKEFRVWQRQRLEQFAASRQKQLEDQELAAQALEHPLVRQAWKIGVTMPLPLEVDTRPLLARLRAQGKQLYLAKCRPGWQLDFVKWDAGTPLQQTKFGVWEVAGDGESAQDLDLLLVPGLAFSPEGKSRIGFGGGYYDRFLAKHQVKTLALVNSAMFFPHPVWATQEHDKAMDDLIIVKEAGDE